MPNVFQINLTSGEIYVLAGLFQQHSVVGIEGITFQTWQADIRWHVRNTVNRLERKKYVLCELNGKILIHPTLHSIMKCICEPTVICVVSGNLKTDKDSTMYILEKNGEYTTISKLDEDTYKIVLHSEYDIGTALTGYFDCIKEFELHEKMLIEDAEFVQSRIQAFQTDEAAAYLRKCVTSGNAAERIYRILAKTDGFIEIQFLRKRKNFYESVVHKIVSVTDGFATNMDLDENDVLSFSHFEPQEFQKEIQVLFTRSTEEIE